MAKRTTTVGLDGHVDKLPADPRSTKTPIAMDAVPDEADFSQRLYIQMNELSRSLPLVEHRRRLGRLQERESGQAYPPQHRRHRRAGHFQPLRNLPSGESLAPKGDDLVDSLLRYRSAQSMRSGATIHQPCLASLRVATQPLVDRGIAHVVGGADHSHRPSFSASCDHCGSTHRGRLGVTMNSHSGSSSGALESSTTPFSMWIPGDLQPLTLNNVSGLDI
jgi:hypothetical protein